VLVDIPSTSERKLDAMPAFKSQVQPAPNEGSLEALRALATLRGATIRRAAVETFVNIRQVL
jgi:LmbE family N-acetylglucosaminyl deacetylase